MKTGRHRKAWVIRKQGEELDPTCIIKRILKKKGGCSKAV